MRLTICHMLFGNEFGGATVIVRLLSQYQLRQGHQVVVLCNNIQRSKQEFIDHDIPLVNFKRIKGTISPLSDLFSLLRLFSFIKNNKFDIVHTHAVKAGFLGRLAAKLAATKLIIHSSHGYGFQDKFRHSPALKKMYITLERLFSKITEVHIVPSQSDYKLALKYRLATKEKTWIIYNGIDISPFNNTEKSINRLEFRKQINISSDVAIIGTVARLHEAKGHRYLIDAAELLLAKNKLNILFVFVGDGPQEEFLRKRINEKNLQEYFQFLGHRDDIPRVMQGIDIHVLPSVREGLPVVLLEAMAAANPCIATAVGGNIELIENEITGFIVPSRDPHSLAHAIETLLEDEEMSTKLAERALSRIQAKFSSEVMSRKISELAFQCFNQS